VHVIATAGHVDHGKSTLVRALTGMQPDRWAEERRRGMTIDLGYAWTTLAGGQQIAFVDVPGHERFVTNMLAGAGPVPAVLFVVAADEGWRAQSSEHLDALNALQVRHGVLAVTRADLGDPDATARQAVEQLAGTTLAGLPTVPVSAVTGAGLADLRAALGRLVQNLPTDADTSSSRLWVDRVFTVRGAGTVVTGTLGSGLLRRGDEVQIRPSGRRVRVRGLETLRTTVDEARAVARVAVNLRGIRPDEIRRGDALTAPGLWGDVRVLDVRLHLLVARAPTSAVLHVGSAAVPVRIRPLGDDTARLTLATALPVHIGEHAVLRDPGAHQVVAGVTVLDTMPPGMDRRGAARRRADELVALTGVPDAGAEVSRRGAVRRDDLVAAGVRVPVQLAGSVANEGWLVSDETWKQWSERLLVAVDTWATTHPEHPGMSRRSAAAAAGVPDLALLDGVARAARLVVDADGVHRRDAVASVPDDVARRLAGFVERLREDPFAAPDAPELAAAGLTERHLAVATRADQLIKIASGVYLHPDAIAEAVRRLSSLEQPFTMSQARTALGTTRRVAVPLLELLDGRGLTHRVDSQHRVVRPN
jgi:selenocysteine-specific elongation factor